MADKIDPKDLSIYEPLLAEFRKERNVHRGKRMPYVLFGMVGRDYDSKTGQYRPDPRLVKLNCSGAHGQESAIMNQIKAGMVILDYWFPTEKDLPKADPNIFRVESGWQLRLRNGENNFPELERIVKRLKEEASTIYQQKEEIDKLKLKVLEYEGKANSNAGRAPKSA